MTPETRIEYARIVWQEWLDRRKDDGMGFMTPGEWFLITKWMDAEIPLRIVLRGIQDCAGKITSRTRLTYVESAVNDAVDGWRRAIA